MLNKYTLIGIAGAAIILVVGVYYYFHMQYDIAAGPEAWGSFGDYLGGVLSPILMFMTILLLIFDLRFTREELKLTRKELEQATNAQEAQVDVLQQASRIATYTTLIRTYNDLCINPGGSRGSGRDLSDYYKKIAKYADKRIVYETLLLEELQKLGHTIAATDPIKL